ncbi:multidrug resistance-associated protein 1-like [Mercenaria mercenaria]|uniref:multidrug resistance-associated protein 1-like n=1 Tax=Mercenaria mercenaria TaxID=6596 RepID=UPI00234EB874|nr:multidrug resistance-associated protein 1-like [Mercenaria mercenaria]
MFESICKDYSFWDSEKVLQATPEFSPCFEDTVLVWIPYGYLWLTLVPYLLYLSRRDQDPPLPWTAFMITKTILTVFLFALTLTDALLTKENGYRCSNGGDVPPSVYIADGIKAGTFLLILILEQYMRVLGVKSSGVPFVFWLLITVANLVPLYSVSASGVWCSTSTLLCIQFGFMCIQLFLRCFADQYKNRGYHGLDPDPCPEENASVLNKITFSWITSLVIKAYKQTLTSKDLWTQTRRLQSKRVVGHFLRNWKLIKNKMKERKISRAKEQSHTYSRYSKDDYQSERTPLLGNGYGEEHGANNVSFGTLHADTDIQEGPSIFKVVIKSFGWLWIEACGYKIIGDAVNLLQPVILRYIIDVIERKDDANAYPAWIGFSYAVALFVTSMIKSLVWQTCLHNMIGLGLTIKTALIGAVYRKALTLSNSAKKTSTVGEIVNLMSVDCQRIQDAFTFSHHIISLPFVTIVAMVQLWMLMGVAMFGGLAVVLVAIIVNGVLGRMQQRLQIQILRNKSKRVKILNEVINGIKVLKMYTWEIPFQKKVSAIRKEEISRLWKYAMLTAVAILFSIHSPFMVNYMLVLVYTLIKSVHYLDAQTAFVALSLVNILRGPITLTPFIINGVIQGYVSLCRIQAFLWKDDINEDNVAVKESGEYMINIENGSFTWDRNDPKTTLNGIDLKLREGQIYAVVGQVGCGKSSLISAILGEIEKLEGTVNLRGKIAYVPQEAWIQNMTVRDNIIFGNEWNLERYNKVLTGCAMVPDLEMLSGGDMTEIGEKGINISGGQKQRVSLARAVYSDADIYLLDDPLSAVDSHVGKHLFKNVIGPQGLLKRKTRILVTHGIHWLPMVDKILVITDGKISETGTYEELISRDGPFANLVQTYLENNESDADDTEVHTANGVPDDIAMSKSSTRRRRHKSSEREKSFGMSFTKEHSSNKDMKRNDQLMSRLVQEEQSQKGAVKFAVFQKYAKFMGYIALLFVMLFMVAFQSLNVFSNYWLTYWTEDELMKNTSLGYTSDYEEKYVYYLVCYTIIGVIQGGAIFAFGALALTRMVRASGILHNSMLECILRSPMSFFDTTPVGRIMNRFSSDIDVMDDRLPLNFRLWTIQIFSTVATIIVVSINTPIFMVVIVPVTIIYLMLLKFFLPTARQVKRLESVLRSPIYNHFSETITGVSVIRAYKCMDRFIEESEKRIDTNIKFFFAALSASRWIAIRLETLGNILILAAAVFALISTGLNGAQVGLSITYALQITISLNLVIQAVSEMEMNIVSAERVKEYTELYPEAPWSIKSRRPSSEWPRTGSIEFRLFRTRYREGLELTLKGISCQIRSGEKVGIVGRTGAGKSSLALSLFRLIESAGGAIIIDGKNVADIGLHDLRSKLTILPQDPVLFSGTLRENLDPFGKYDEHSVWKALECAHLKQAVDHMPGQLEYECGEGGSNLSVGQRQLVCLARTLLHKTKILILDEATAAVDLETDELIQETIRTEFSDCTILTIAHRLNTVLDYDRVLVLSEGKILELDAPGKLLQDPNSVFFKMAKDAGLVS